MLRVRVKVTVAAAVLNTKVPRRSHAVLRSPDLIWCGDQGGKDGQLQGRAASCCRLYGGHPAQQATQRQGKAEGQQSGIVRCVCHRP